MLNMNFYTVISVFVLVELALLGGAAMVPRLYRNSFFFKMTAEAIQTYIGQIEQHRKIISRLDGQKEKCEERLRRVYFEINELTAEDRLLNREFQGCILELNLPVEGSRPFAFLVSNNRINADNDNNSLAGTKGVNSAVLCVLFSHSEPAAVLTIKQTFRKEDGYKCVLSKTALDSYGLYQEEKLSTMHHI